MININTTLLNIDISKPTLGDKLSANNTMKTFHPNCTAGFETNEFKMFRVSPTG